MLETDGVGPDSAIDLDEEVIVDGLTVPWAIAFVSSETFFVSERGGAIRLVEDGVLQVDPLVVLPAGIGGESGLLGLATHDDFEQTRRLFVYRTLPEPPQNVVERYLVSDDLRSAELDVTIIEGIPASTTHDGGRLRFGPDGFLYVGTGDARQPDRSQDLESLAGKILRVDEDGAPAAGNPFEGSRVYAFGVRNTQGFDWLDDDRMIMCDHGPSGGTELRIAHDEINVVEPGDNLGWPQRYACEVDDDTVAPRLTFANAAPPGGLATYRGDNPDLRGSAFVGILRGGHLHRVEMGESNLSAHDVFWRERYGRIREVISAPDGSLLVTTSNCDGRGTCPNRRDVILRVP